MYRRSARVYCRIDVTGFVGIMIVLPFIMMIAMSLHRWSHPGASVDLAMVSNPTPMRAANREDAIHIWITMDNKVYFNNSKASANEIPGRIADAVRKGAEKKVYIHADHRARYQNVKDVLDQIRAAGIQDVAFMVEQRRPSSMLPE